VKLIRYLLPVVVALPSIAQGVVIPSDIVVTFAAFPSTNLSAGTALTLMVTAANLGPQPVNTLVLQSSNFTNQFDFRHASFNCNGFVISVLDGVSGPEQFMNWYVAALPLGTAPFAVGETRTCEIDLALSSAAPGVFPFTFGLAHQYVDVNTTNDSMTVVLLKTVQSVPALSIASLLLLAGLLAATARHAARLRHR
jgi:hypothetical protein